MDWINEVIKDVAELDYSSPDGQPDVMLVTAVELRAILLERFPKPEIKLLETGAPRGERDAVVAAVPEGWMLVPIEPTEKMLNATYASQHCSDIWQDMLEAAPEVKP